MEMSMNRGTTVLSKVVESRSEEESQFKTASLSSSISTAGTSESTIKVIDEGIDD